MALSLSCSCGARFEVDDTFAGQVVSCPECQRSLKTPSLVQGPVRTSGYAVASAVLALVGAFTIVLTVIAVILGALALVDISRNRGRSAGSGYALFGILCGLAFTGLTVFAMSKGELFEEAGGRGREQLLRSQVKYGGPREIVQEQDGFAITRPSEKWGVALPQMAQGLAPDPRLVLVNLAEDASIDIYIEQVRIGQTLKQCADKVEAEFRDPSGKAVFGREEAGLRLSGFKLRERHTLPADGVVEREEMLLDLKMAGHTMTFLVRLFKVEGSARMFVVRARAAARRFPRVEADVRRALDSFHLLRPRAEEP
jgi:hypothetical protein